MPTLNEQNAVYEGMVSHNRRLPRAHGFNYSVSMVYLDLDTLPEVFALSRWWSLERWNLASFRRTDYLGNPESPLKSAVLECIAQATGENFAGRVCMLTNLRYFGFIINPITCYYCFDQQSELRYVVAEVTNTPWRERHTYVIPVEDSARAGPQRFHKAMHVSPFMPMEMEYVWRNTQPGENLGIYMQNQHQGQVYFSAALNLQRRPVTTANLNRLLWRYPLMTLQVGLGIYWQALRLWFKGIAFVPHPGSTDINGSINKAPVAPVPQHQEKAS